MVRWTVATTVAVGARVNIEEPEYIQDEPDAPIGDQPTTGTVDDDDDPSDEREDENEAPVREQSDSTEAPEEFEVDDEDEEEA
jgi:hypothetical protein